MEHQSASSCCAGRCVVVQRARSLEYAVVTFCRVFSYTQAVKIPAAKAAVDKEWEKLEKISAWNLTKVKSKK